MMPSRGLRLVRSHAPGLRRSQCRNLSSTPRPAIRSHSQIVPNSLPRRPAVSSRPHLYVPTSIAAVRHASSSSSSPSTPPAQSASPASNTATADAPAFPNLDTITLDNIDLSATADIAALPEQIGYLSQIGIDYGLGPTSAIQWVLEHIHVYSGLPWWASIAATAVALRAVTFPLYLRSSDSMARQNALASVTKPLTDRMTAARKAGDSAAAMAALQQLGAVRKQAGIRLSDQFAPMLLQGVLGYCGFKLTRALAALPVPGLRDGGFLWLTDLTLPDGFVLVPLAMAASVHVLVRLGGESGAGNGAAAMPAGMRTFMLWGMPGLIGLVTAFQPGAVCMWFAGSGAVGIAQSLLLQNARARAFLGLAPMYRPAKGEAADSMFSAMLKDYESKPAGSSKKKSAPGAGQNSAASMRPTYQAPVLRSQGRVIDTSLVGKSGSASSDEMVSPGKKPAGSGGLFAGISKAVDEAKEKVRKAREIDPRADYERRAAAYERNAQQRRRR